MKKKKNNNVTSDILLAVDILGIITAGFGSVIGQFKILWFSISFISCILLIGLLWTKYKGQGAVIGVIVSAILLGFTTYSLFNSNNSKFSDKIDENTPIGNLRITSEEILAKYSNSDGANYLTNSFEIEKDLCEKILLKSIDYDVVVDDYELSEGRLIFENIPVGTYEIQIKLDGYSLFSETIKLKESDLIDQYWDKNFYLQTDKDYKQFNIRVFDNENELLSKYNCDFILNKYNKSIDGILSNENGELPYTFLIPDESEFDVVLHYGDDIYTESFKVNEISNPLDIHFKTPPKEKVKVTEQHVPNDVAKNVSVSEWDKDKDLGNDGKRYGGGLKIVISDMFISMGSNGKEDITSRILVPMSKSDHFFEGVFVLNQNMFGSKSSGTISILVNDEIVFTTNEIDGNNTNSFPFKIDYGNADSITILTEAHLSGSSFEFGIVSVNKDE